jgi:hypothetical protein
LYSGENAHRHLALLLEIFNNVIQYQYHGNTHLVYAIIRRKVRISCLLSCAFVLETPTYIRVYSN